MVSHPNQRVRRAGRVRQTQQASGQNTSEHFDGIFRLAEDRAKWALVATLLEAQLRQILGDDKADAVIRSLTERADAWIDKVKTRCRSIAIDKKHTTPDLYGEILCARAESFGDLPQPLPKPRPGPKRMRPGLSPLEALRRYREVLHARAGGVPIERLAKEWAPALRAEELITLDRRPDTEVAARLAGAAYGVSLAEMRKKLLPKARAERFQKAAAFARERGESLIRDDFDENSVTNEDGDWVQRRGRWFFRPWVDGPDRRPDLGSPVRVKGPGRCPE